MSEVNIPEEEKITSDVLENNETEEVEQVNLADKTLAELSELFQKLGSGIERVKRSKEAEAIKSAFYKRLSKEKADAGLAHQFAQVELGAGLGLAQHRLGLAGAADGRRLGRAAHVTTGQRHATGTTTGIVVGTVDHQPRCTGAVTDG